MKKASLLLGIGGLTLLSCLFISGKYTLAQNLNPKQQSFTAYDSAYWKARPIAKVGEHAPGGGIFEEIGDTYFLETGVLLFWGQFGKSEKNWALYSYKNGRAELAFKAFEEFTELDGIIKEFAYYDTRHTRPYQLSNKASQNLLYLYSGKGGFGVNSDIYSFNGDALIKIIGKGDKITISGNREVIVSGVRLDRITNDNQAVIFFVSENPKVKGWILHGKTGLKPLFIVGDEVPGLSGVKINELYATPIYENFAKEINLFIFNDTLLVKLYVAPFREGIFRITPHKTEFLDTLDVPFPLNIINAATGNNFIIRSDNLYQFRDGKRIAIMDRNHTFSADKKGNPIVVKGKPIYSITSVVFLGSKKDEILLGIKWNDYFEQSLYHFANGNLTSIERIRPQPDNIVSPYLLGVRPAHNGHGAFVDNVFKDDKGIFYAIGPIAFTKNVKIEKGGLYFDGVGKALKQAQALITDSEDYFDNSNIIAQPDPDRLIVWRRTFLANRDLFELVK